MSVPPIRRRTVSGPAELRGVTLFTGVPSTCTILPRHEAEPGLIVRVKHRDGSEAAPHFPATLANLSDAPVHPAFASIPPRCTALACPDDADAIVWTVEHVLSALVGLGVTDAIVEVSGPEPPIYDGSARAIADALTEAGLLNLDTEIEPLSVREPVTVEDDRGGRITAEPRDENEHGCLYSYELDYGPGAPIPAQRASWDSGAPDAHARYAEEIAPARTFSLQTEAALFASAGLFGHLSPKDMLVIGEGGPVDNALRFENEPARHKLLDLIGDLALVGRPLHARITAVRAGHTLNHRMASALLRASGR